ncbi:16371_t:CDS:2 [Cetraspora pellucida]|uniref:16371_t:CDS:1 n=1 Tax=Cetraspora pellucida TaxID=1433469 RepID=A0ACA9LVL1_9GLOM|nr:16371_t:CDS:2 [Cetraspora pellucida]
MKYTNNSSITSSSKGNVFEIKVFRLVKNKIKIDCQRDDMIGRELEAHRGHRGCYKNQVIIACERPFLFYLLSEWLSRGDVGMDMFGNHNHYLLLFQCKDLTNKVEVDKVGIKNIILDKLWSLSVCP